MARPSWLPASLIPGVRDFVAEYVDTLPGFLPEDLTQRAADIYKEFEALGEQLAYWREVLEWLLRLFFPASDSEAMWLPRHERDYGIVASGLSADAISLRQRTVLAKMRNRGTLTEERARAIWAPVFDVPPDEIGFCFVDVAGTVYSDLSESEIDWHKAVQSYSIRVFHTLETAEPNVPLGQATANQLAQSGERWFFGRSCNFAFGQYGNGFGAGLGS